MLSTPNMRLVTLAKELLDRTKKGLASWEPADPDGSAFFLTTTRAQIVIESMEHDGEPSFRLALLSHEDTEVDSIEQFTREGDDFIRNDWSELLVQLFAAARRNALKVDEVVNSVFDELGIGKDAQ